MENFGNMVTLRLYLRKNGYKTVTFWLQTQILVTEKKTLLLFTI
jgi:hypothetical protein